MSGSEVAVGGVIPSPTITADVAIQLGVCRQTVYTYIYHEGLPSIKVRGIRRVHPDSLHSWLREREQQTA